MNILTVLDRATQKDLDQVAKELDAAEKRVAGLTALKRLLVIKLHGKAPRKSPTKKPVAQVAQDAQAETNGAPLMPSPREVQAAEAQSGSAVDRHRDTIAHFLETSGPTTRVGIVHQTNVPNIWFERVVNFEWFTRAGDRYALTDKGKEAARKLAKGLR